MIFSIEIDDRKLFLTIAVYFLAIHRLIVLQIISILFSSSLNHILFKTTSVGAILITLVDFSETTSSTQSLAFSVAPDRTPETEHPQPIPLSPQSSLTPPGTGRRGQRAGHDRKYHIQHCTINHFPTL